MGADRKLWNQQQKAWRHALEHSDNCEEAIELFLSQHATVHSAKMSGSGLWSFADKALQDVVRLLVMPHTWHGFLHLNTVQRAKVKVLREAKP
jgi:hypothetical protein